MRIETVNVLIDVADAALAARLDTALRAAGHAVWTDPPSLPANAPIQVVVTTSVVDNERCSLREAAAAGATLLTIGHEHPAADVGLPDDFTDRELVLACRLLAQVARWRNAALHGAGVRDELQRAADCDPLTAALNRRAWDRELDRRLTSAGAAGQSVCLAMFDVDHFKRINDEQGHAVGDAVLRAVVRALHATLRSTDLVARLGGDEFGAMLIGGFDSLAAEAVVERARLRTNAEMASVAAGAPTVSAGCVVLVPTETGDAQGLCQQADAALRAAKQAGRNRTARSEV